jgi:hypothetical protein
MLMDDVRGEIVLRRLPKEILDTLSPDQTLAIRRATSSAQARRHPVDARFNLHLPLLGGLYLVLLVGKELRSPSRRRADRVLRPTDRLSRLIVAMLGASALILAAFLGILIENAITS